VANSEPTVFKNVCPLECPDTCSMRVTVQDGVAIDLKGDAEHAFTRGFLCQKMARYLDRVYSPDQLMFSMKRVGAKGAGKFERISWEDALEAITTRFAAIPASPDGSPGYPSPQPLRHDGQASSEQPGPVSAPASRSRPASTGTSCPRAGRMSTARPPRR